MPLGWVDFSKKDRNKVLEVLGSLSENGALDELGIATIRDGFSNIFFPGTSTIQTRAKYFFIVPYALRDLERGDEIKPNEFLKILDDIEKKCAKELTENFPQEKGIIGRRSLAANHWVKRTPADIYWNALQKYGIFCGGRISLSEYARVVCTIKRKKKTLIDFGNYNDREEENGMDDKGAGDIKSRHFLNIPTYDPNWYQDLQMTLSYKEAGFLKEQIIGSCGGSMFAYGLKNEMWDMMDCNDFSDLKKIIRLFPEQIKENYELALQFSEFNYVLRIIYNVILSKEENEEANEKINEYCTKLDQIANIDLEQIFKKTGAQRNAMMCKFLREAKIHMQNNNIAELKQLVKSREIALKGRARARTAHPGDFDKNVWFGGKKLDYRFHNAMRLMLDIYTGQEEAYVKSI